MRLHFALAVLGLIVVTVLIVLSAEMTTMEKRTNGGEAPAFGSFSGRNSTSLRHDNEGMEEANEFDAVDLRRPNLHFATYGNGAYAGAKARLVSEANSTGWFSTIHPYGPEDLPSSFSDRFKEILRLERGGGYWCWKIPVIEMTLESMKDGDVLVYLDAGCEVNAAAENRFRQYVRLLADSPYDIFSFEMPQHREDSWTTENIFQAFGVATSDATIRETGQYVGGIFLVRKGQHAKSWIESVKKVIELDPWLLTDIYNVDNKKKNSNFKENRHDQSILSVSRKIAGGVTLRDETYPSNQEEFPFWASRKKGKGKDRG